MSELQPNDDVVKKSGKPFESGHKIATILGYGMMHVGGRFHQAAVLCGCKDMVQLRMLKKAPPQGEYPI